MDSIGVSLFGKYGHPPLTTCLFPLPTPTTRFRPPDMSLPDPSFRTQDRAPRRKPVTSSGPDQLRPLTKINPDSPPVRSAQPLSPPYQQPNHRQNLSSATASSAHSRSRTASSGTLPGMNTPQPYVTATPGNPPMPYQQWAMNQQSAPARRTLSNATTSTTSTTGPTRKPSSSSSTLQRSTSSRSGNSPTSYVALMRKQKATVWSDRAQVSPSLSLTAKLFVSSDIPSLTLALDPARGRTAACSTARRQSSSSHGSRWHTARHDPKPKPWQLLAHGRRALQDTPPRRPESPAIRPDDESCLRRTHAPQRPRSRRR